MMNQLYLRANSWLENVELQFFFFFHFIQDRTWTKITKQMYVRIKVNIWVIHLRVVRIRTDRGLSTHAVKVVHLYLIRQA
uniref:Uncharacterized protein n=1 Tax=Octopus bimaculoides TaxID=37653 RepID=A0A0L8FKY4_OCTBM